LADIKKYVSYSNKKPHYPVGMRGLRVWFWSFYATRWFP